MSKKNNQLSYRFTFITSVMILAVLLTLPGCKKKSVENPPTENNQNRAAPSTPVAENSGITAKPENDSIAEPNTAKKTSLNDVIRAARTWKPAYSFSFGKKAPDFTLTDINGRQHSLSDYRGKNTMIIFWATWCGPCKAELPHLIALRNILGEDKLAMLAISYKSTYPPETAEKVKEFTKQNKINYTVFSVDPAVLSSPFNRISGIPCSFFIDPEGKIKLATEGLLSLGEIKAILQAE